MDQTPPQLTIIIPTRNRADSLRITLQCLAMADRSGIAVEIAVVDNGGSDHTKDVVAEFHERIPIRYFYQPALGVYGKSHSINQVLEAGGLGEIIVVLDDDMSPHPDWIQKVVALCNRYPDRDIFGGKVYIIWPSENIPAWADTSKSRALVFSSIEYGDSEIPLEDGRWFGGNHFWFRSRVLEKKPRFKDTWLTEPDFQLDLAETGSTGAWDPAIQAGHRIQVGLLDREGALRRVRGFGVEEAWLRLKPYRHKMKQARMLHEHPWLGRGYCLARLLGASLQNLGSYFYASDGRGFVQRLDTASRMAYFRELLRATAQLDDYSLSAARRKKSAHQPVTGLSSEANRS